MLLNHLFLGASVFLATVVELVEALTIILALGVTRGWRSVLLGTAAALVTLAAIIIIFGEVMSYVSDEDNLPIKPLWAIVGSLLLIFGVQWMKKSILRISGIMPSRDEDEIYKKVTRDAKKTPSSREPIDWYSFVLAYKGVLLEGLEVIFIVLIFGGTRGELGVGVTAAVAALLFVIVLGVFIHKPLSRVPENALKLSVGLLLVTFGTYFGAEGTGVIWPFGEWALLYLLVIYAGFTYGSIVVLRQTKIAANAKVTL